MSQASGSMSAGASGGVVVAAQGLSKVFKDFWMRDRARAVDGVTFEIRAHEVFGLLGPNGSGKSTTIKMILGLLRPSAGRLAVFGKPPTDVEAKRRIGYLPEESYLYPFLDARETLDYYGKLFELGHRERTQRVDELLDMVGLSGAQHRPVREYSKGMARRLGIAQALINDPDFLILDEPTTGLDPLGTRQIKDLIIALGKRGKTVLLSSHLLADVEDCVDRMVILYGGKIRATGTCDELLESTDRTSIEADTLDEGTLTEIDEVIRRRTGGSKSLRKVTRPRQSLEALFLDIVAKARAENAATSGAQHGGSTASFLAGGEAGEGSSLIENLVKDDLPPPAVEPVRGTVTGAPRVQEPEDDVIARLTGVGGGEVEGGGAGDGGGGGLSRPRAVAKGAPSVPAKAVDTTGVDQSVISKLLGGQGGGEGEGKS